MSSIPRFKGVKVFYFLAALALVTRSCKKTANSSAWCWVRISRKMVSSPAMVPTRPFQPPVSTATQTALAMPA